MRPYSIDLRERVVAAYEAGEGSLTVIGERFDIDRRTVFRWVHQRQQRGTLEPIKPRGRARMLDAAGEQALLELVDEQPDATIAELQQRLIDKIGVRLSTGALSNYLARLDRRKKITGLRHETSGRDRQAP